MLYECALRIVYNDSVLSFHNLLSKNNSPIILHHYIPSLTTEVYKNLNYLPEEAFEELFT